MLESSVGQSRPAAGLDGVRVIFRNGAQALDDITLALEPNSLTGLVGALLAVRRQDRVEAPAAQAPRQEVPYFFMVLDQQNAHGQSSSDAMRRPKTNVADRADW